MLRTSAARAVALVLLASPALADVLHVDADLPNGTGDGLSWATAFGGVDGLQAALAVATSGDQVFVAAGTYLPSSTGSRSESFTLIDGVELYGGFEGTEASPAERPASGATTTLSGGVDGDGTLAGNSYHVVRMTGSTATAVLDRFVVSGGSATSAGGNNDRGGGILCVGDVSPTIRDCRFVLNRSTFGGGHGYVSNGAGPRFVDCLFLDGDGGSFGGAFDIAGGDGVVFDRCTFENNTAGRGGALEIFSSTDCVVSNCLFTGNSSTGPGNTGGGGLWIGSGGDTRVRNCTVFGNTSANNNVGGLRVANANQTTVRNTILWGNVGPAGTSVQQAQMNAAADASYCIVEGDATVYGGVGNTSLDPLFVDAAFLDLRVADGSPAIDAGDNTEVPPGATLDVDGAPRFVDAPLIADTGVGTAPVVDIGAHEFDPTGGTPFLDLGQDLAGTNGAPVLELSGFLIPNTLLTVDLSNALPSSTAFFVTGFTAVDAPLKGGVLVPSPDVLVGLPTIIDEIVFGVTWPAGVPSGFESYFQVWVIDAGGPSGFAVSNAILMTTP